MIKLLLLLVLPLSIYASKILSYNDYSRTDRFDIMITFDTPYEGVIKQSVRNSTISIKLEDASIESAKRKQISSKFISSLSITPMSGYTKIVVSVPPSVKLRASKTSDSYGLRLRFTNKSAIKNTRTTKKQLNEPKLSALPTKKSGDMDKSYYMVIAILIVGIILLLVIKKRVTPAKFKEEKQKLNKNKNKNSWLFQETTTPEMSGDVSIRFQKSIDQENSVVMLDFSGQSYLIMMGSTNVLLDRFQDDEPKSQSDFETILQSRHKELDNFLHKEDEEETKEPLQAYKERASSISYNV